MAGKKKPLSPEDILRASKMLARDVLRESLAELVYEASNGLDRDRIRRFSGLADQAHELLNSEVAIKGGAPTPGILPRAQKKGVMLSISKARTRKPRKERKASDRKWTETKCPCGRSCRGPSAHMHARKCETAKAQGWKPDVRTV